MAKAAALGRAKSKGARKSALKVKRSAAKRSSRRKELFFFWGRRAVIAFTSIVLVGWLGAWFILSNAHIQSLNFLRDQLWKGTAAMGFRAEEFLVEGREYTDSDAMLAVMNIVPGDPIFSFYPHEAQEQLEKIDWVERAFVQRRLPNTIYIRLTERTPVAMWRRDDGRIVLVDASGALIEATDLKLFDDLLMIKGEGAKDQASELLGVLSAEPEIFSRVDHADLIDQRRWNIVLKDGKLIKLPENDLGLALSHIVKTQENEDILNKDVITDIDARYQGRLIVRTKLGSVRDFKASHSK